MADDLKTTPPEQMTDEEIGLETSRLIRHGLGWPDEPGSCQDCGGVGMIPSLALTKQHGRSLWKQCPTCSGQKVGGRA